MHARKFIDGQRLDGFISWYEMKDKKKSPFPSSMLLSRQGRTVSEFSKKGFIISITLLVVLVRLETFYFRKKKTGCKRLLKFRNLSVKVIV